LKIFVDCKGNPTNFPASFIQSLKSNIMVRYTIILLISFFFFINNTLEASHVRGGNIRYTHLGPGSVAGTQKYKVVYGVFRDCNGIDYSTTSERITAVCRPGGSPRIVKTAYKVNYLPKVGERPSNRGAKDVSDICRSKSSRCAGNGNPGGYEVNYYEAVFELPVCNYWEMYTGPSQCCRNTSSNINTGNYYIPLTRLVSTNAPKNSSPIISDLVKPFPSVCAGQDVSYSFGAVDPDGDSLRFVLERALSGISSTGNYSYSTYKSGYSGAIPIPGIKLDSTAGLITFKTSLTGYYVVAYWLIEYDRCTGKESGRTMCEVQFNVRSCSNNSPKDISGISNLKGATKTGINEMEVCRGSKFSWSDTIEDPDGTDSLWFGSNLNEVLPGAKMTTTVLTRNKAVVNFEWTASVGNNPNKMFFLKYDDNRCDFPLSGYSVFKIKVKNGTFAGEDQVVCEGDTAFLSADGGRKYTWRSLSANPLVTGVNWFPDTTSTDTGKTGMFVAKGSTYLEVTSDLKSGCLGSSNCKKVDTVLIKTADSFKIKMVPDFTLCNPGKGQLNVFPSNNRQNYFYSWNNSSFLDKNNIKNPNFSGIKYNEIFNVTVTNDSGCVRKGVVKVNVTEPFPQNMNATVSDSLICISKQVNLRLDKGSIDYDVCSTVKNNCQGIYKNFTVGIGAQSSAGGGIQNMPLTYGSRNLSQKNQYLYLASELKSLGMQAGPISSIAFQIKSLYNNASSPFNAFTIKMGCTNLNTMPKTTFVNSLIEVYSPKSVLAVVGWNTHSFDNEYTWDGKSNLIVEVCWQNVSKLNSHHLQNFDATSYPASNSYYQTDSFNLAACPSKTLSPGFPTSFLPRTRFNACSGIRSTKLKYSWHPTSNGNFVGATNRDSAIVNANISTAKKYFVVVTDSATGVCRDTLEVPVSVVSSYNSKPNFRPTQCYSQGRIQLTAPTPWNITNPGGRWSGVGVINDSLGYWDPSISGLGSFMVKYKIQGDVCASEDSATIKIVGDPDPTVLSPDSFCGIYGGPGSFDTIRHRLVPKNPGGWFSGFGVDSAVKSIGSRMNYFLDGTKFNPTPNRPDTAYVRYTLTDGCTSDSLFKIPVIAPWDHNFLGVNNSGTPYPTISFCTTNPEMDTLAVAGASPTWEYIDNPTAMVDRNLGVLDVKLASFGKDTIGRIKVGYYGFCGSDTTISIQFVKPPEIEICPKIYCENFLQDPANFARIDTLYIRIPKGVAIGGSGNKTLDSNGFDSNTEVKVAYVSIGATGWPQAIDQVASQYSHNYWNGSPWMMLPNFARYRAYAIPKGKNPISYTFGFRYRQNHPDFACYSYDTAYVERTDSMLLTLKDTHRICGSNSVELDAGKYTEATYSWNTGATTRKLIAFGSVVYTVTVTTDFCRTTKSTLVINGCVGVEENLENGVQIKLFPNPASTIINLVWNGAKSETTQLRIIDLLGNEVSTSVFDSSEANNSMSIDVGDLAKGVYLFEIVNGESYSTYRVVVE